MGILDKILDSVLPDENDSSSGTAAKPCKNCPSSCQAFPGSCDVCRPYKEKLTDLLYDVDHLEEYYDRYEVTGTETAAAGSTTCPACGAPNPSSACACEYCGTALKEGSGKIRVARASDIPDPIALAQDTIFERLQAVGAGKDTSSGSGSGLFDVLGDLLGMGDSGSGSSSPVRMSTDEITETAQAYGVSVGTYLQGLDNGKYLTASQKKAEAASTASSSSGSPLGGLGTAAAGLGGLGTLAGIGSMILNSSSNSRSQTVRSSLPRQNRREERVQKQQSGSLLGSLLGGQSSSRSGSGSSQRPGFGGQRPGGQGGFGGRRPGGQGGFGGRRPGGQGGFGGQRPGGQGGFGGQRPGGQGGSRLGGGSGRSGQGGGNSRSGFRSGPSGSRGNGGSRGPSGGGVHL